ncbi:MAG: hypothetical protein IJN85_01270 [Oscillospiraceae bacterium]|nr:hypothetical protein [Oscillospiraceae bacterium]
MNNRKIALFCSCAGFGTYTPSLLLKEELDSMGCETHIFVFENYLDSESQKQFIEYRKQFHKSFRFAVMASNIAKGTATQEVDISSFEKLSTVKKFDQYVVLYGDWIPVLNGLNVSHDKIVCLHLDTTNPPSWSRIEDSETSYENIWLLGRQGEKPKYKFWDRQNNARKDNALLLHGGGWGINNYLDTVESIKNLYDLHIVYSNKHECKGENNEYYVPIEWMPDMSNLEHPPLCNNSNGQRSSFQQLCADCSGIVSKPGGGSCLDALRFKIPIIMLDGMAKHENINAELYSEWGFGIKYNDWAQKGYSLEVLESIGRHIEIEMREVKLLSEYLCER